MNTRHAQLVLAVAREGSFTAAAKSLFIAQPTLSQQIRQIEQQLGAPIFERGTTPGSRGSPLPGRSMCRPRAAFCKSKRR